MNTPTPQAREQTLARAIIEIWPELPELVGADWDDVAPRLWNLLTQLEADAPGAADAIDDLIAKHPGANRRLQEALARVATPLGEKWEGPAGAVGMSRYVEVPVLFGTDRRPTDDGFADGESSAELALGVAGVSIPEDHEMGEVERPPWWKFGFGWDPEKHVHVMSLERTDRRGFVDAATGYLAQARQREALVFIHGFNVGFTDAVRRTAQVAYDLRFGGLAMLYSWPSADSASKTGYIADGDKIRETRPRLEEFLELVMVEFGLDAVHVIAHSMGNRALVDVLAGLELDDLAPGAATLRQVVFAAPDVNRQTFEDLAEEFWRKAERCTLYASSRDIALDKSEGWNRSPRAGDTDDAVLVTEGIDTVDASAVTTSFLGHSYYGSNDSVISDMDVLIRDGTPPDDRDLLAPQDGSDGRYWVFNAPH